MARECGNSEEQKSCGASGFRKDRIKRANYFRDCTFFLLWLYLFARPTCCWCIIAYGVVGYYGVFLDGIIASTSCVLVVFCVSFTLPHMPLPRNRA